jgi:hypothetical protein
MPETVTEFGFMHVLRVALLILSVLGVGGVAIAHFLVSRPIEAGSAPIAAPAELDARQASPEEIAAARQKIVEVLAATPEYAQVVDRLSMLFPADYEAFLMAASRRSSATGEVPSADVLVFEAARTLRASRGILAAKAGAAALDHVFELQRALLRALALEDPRLCVDFLYGGADEGFFRFSAQNRALVARFALAGLAAITDGQAERIDREAPTRGDLEALEDGLRAKGLEPDEIDAILDGKMADPPIEDERLCRAGRIYLDVLAGLPEPERMRLYGFALELMARS